MASLDVEPAWPANVSIIPARVSKPQRNTSP